MNKLAKVALFFLIFFASIVIICCTLYNYNIGPVSRDAQLKEVTIDDGETFLTIAPLLKENNLIKSEFFYKLYIKIFKPKTFEAGIYELSENMGVSKIVDTISKGSNYQKQAVKITFVEGKNMRYIASMIAEKTDNSEDEVFALLEDKGYIDSLIKDYWFLTEEIKNDKIYYPLEGYLFPDTYEFDKKASVREIFKSMLDNTDKKLTPYKKKIEESGLSVHEILTLSSIVELEGASSTDRASVAGVFYNRLGANERLGSDITGYYGAKMDDWSNGLGEHLNDCNGYNTRGECVSGLPVGPVCNAGIDSIEATLNPEKHKYFFFVADCSGKTYLSYTEREHNRTVDKLKKEGNWCDN